MGSERVTSQPNAFAKKQKSMPNPLFVVHTLHNNALQVYEFFNFWNEIKYLGLQSMSFYILSIFTLIFYSESKKSWRTQCFEIFQIFEIF